MQAMGQLGKEYISQKVTASLVSGDGCETTRSEKGNKHTSKEDTQLPKTLYQRKREVYNRVRGGRQGGRHTLAGAQDLKTL